MAKDNTAILANGNETTEVRDSQQMLAALASRKSSLCLRKETDGSALALLASSAPGYQVSGEQRHAEAKLPKVAHGQSPATS
mmetsp:Transcript_64051/g.113955  ORF Transcript_64051/g.113955 Transcript_64051/m.113955 type:complete len:82 (-) Transcript_64051:3397-3642(-)